MYRKSELPSFSTHVILLRELHSQSRGHGVKGEQRSPAPQHREAPGWGLDGTPGVWAQAVCKDQVHWSLAPKERPPEAPTRGCSAQGDLKSPGAWEGFQGDPCRTSPQAVRHFGMHGSLGLPEPSPPASCCPASFCSPGSMARPEGYRGSPAHHSPEAWIVFVIRTPG